LQNNGWRCSVCRRRTRHSVRVFCSRSQTHSPHERSHKHRAQAKSNMRAAAAVTAPAHCQSGRVSHGPPPTSRIPSASLYLQLRRSVAGKYIPRSRTCSAAARLKSTQQWCSCSRAAEAEAAVLNGVSCREYSKKRTTKLSRAGEGARSERDALPERAGGRRGRVQGTGACG